ncbi:YSC84-related protein [Flavobacterium sp. Arc3]|jgi:lipid-binding SYLF domain-containing protein|uniref:lipid-binding SYLF domain-containing protein n=1 Tax=unclassified Flavobacterium TaxID=196869 RepID=UPI00352F51FB
MKKLNIIGIVMLAFLLNTTAMFAQSKAKKRQIIEDSKLAKEEFIKSDALMESLFDNAAGYVIFPNVGKGGLGIGAAAGNGVVYEGGTIIGMAKLSQLSIGFQAGGQAYREVIFFESQEELNRFKESRFEFSAQASAVAVTEGASTNVKYAEGVMVFTMQKGGLMYEASIGGQKFKFNKM